MTNRGVVSFSGVAESRVAPVIDKILKSQDGQGLIIVSSEIRGKRLAQDLSFFVDKNIYVMPQQEEVFLKYEAKNHDDLLERMKCLKALRTGEDCIVIVPVSTALKKLPPHNVYEEKVIKLTIGEEVNRDEINKQLVSMGYERQQIIDGRGQFSIRGGIIDVYTPDANYPCRIELFDTEIDSIRTFDLDTQRSLENLKYVQIYPAEQIIQEESIFKVAADRLKKDYLSYIKKQERKLTELNCINPGENSYNELELQVMEAESRINNLKERMYQLTDFIEHSQNLQLLENYIHYFYDETEYIWDYMNNGSIMIDDPDRVYEAIDNRNKEIKVDFQARLERGLVIPKDYNIFSSTTEYLKIFERENVFIFSPFQKKIKGVEKLAEIHNIVSRQTQVFNGKMDILETELKNYVKNGYDVTIVCANDERINNLYEFLQNIGLNTKVALKKGCLTSGMEFPEQKICYIWDGDIFLNQKHYGQRKKKSQNSGKAIQSFSDMHKGDYVVHENHGIGKFLGIEQLVVQDVKKDYLKIKYAGEDMLYVPVEQMDLIQKYVGADSITPRVNKLSGGEWKKTKAKAKSAIVNMAKELLELSASRQIAKGHAFAEDNIWQKEFEDSFPHMETDDQIRSIEEIKRDMEKPIALDRLLCGDVGFGKTEVAARAMFKCAADGKQVAVLVPTTILANQHYYTLKERFEKFPFKVEVLSRFRTEKQQDAIIDMIEKGTVDVVIGTHRLLSKDVKFKNLGLLVIDEEQRFGVQHKEVIKQLRQNVDVLTLSATPIPRTLHMSLVGIKDMSLIEEPPEERYPVQTYVLEQDDQLLREAIEREIARGGQIFVVYNRVNGIHKIASQISNLVEEAKVAVGHGQMNERELEDVMLKFINGETNVLVATTIIESGLDIPNANTMIVLNADYFGLSQLYQLRGRVGRSNKIAYAYLMHQKNKILSEVAEKRLRAIKEFTEFGAGFKIAMKDLEIRGAGNLLGMEQHGHMMTIGYELYCKLVDDAVRALGGEVVNPDREEASIEIKITAYIPDAYISDEILKLQMYKKIATVANQEDEEEIIDELLDRFGEIPKDTMNLIKVSRIRAMAQKLCITRIHENGTHIIFDLAKQNPIDAYAYGRLSEEFGMRVIIYGGIKPMIKYTLKKKDKLMETIKVLEIMLEKQTYQ